MAEVAKTYGAGPTRVQYQNKDPRGYAEFMAQLAEHSTQGSANTMRGVQARRPSLWDLTDKMKTLDVPTLVMTGDEDDPCLEPGLLMKRLIPSAALVVFPNTGHALNIEEPDLFNRSLRRFLSPGRKRALAAPRPAREHRLDPGDVTDADRASRDAATTLGLTLPGDTTLYLLLPLHAAAFGVSLPEAGLLLAVNRLVRIAGYGWVVRGYERFGPRTACFVAALGAAGSTLGYATLSGGLGVDRRAASLGALLRRAQHRDAGACDRRIRPRGAAQRPGAGDHLGGADARAADRARRSPPISGRASSSRYWRGCPAAACRWRCDCRAGAAQTVRSARRRFGVPSPLDQWSFIQGLTLDGIFVVGLSLLASATARKARPLPPARRWRCVTSPRSCWGRQAGSAPSAGARRGR